MEGRGPDGRSPVAKEDATAGVRPSIISWNLTRLCNERCRHCYLDAGPNAGRGDELTTTECLGVLEQLQRLAPGALIIFTGGEPLLRPDLEELARAAREAGFTVVVGTNGLLLTPERLRRLRAAGVQGVALSLDSLDEEVHDGFRGRRGAWQATLASIDNLAREGFPFVLQTTVTRANLGEVRRLIALAAEKGARAHNLYFLVPTGRGRTFASDLSPDEYEALLEQIPRWQEEVAGRGLIIGVKCAPHYQRLLRQRRAPPWQRRTFAGGAGACPAGIHYLGIRPDGDVTPCPYLPAFGGNLRRQPLADIWYGSDLFRRLRARQALGGRCGACEFRLLCGGCRARALGEGGDPLGEDPLCAYVPGAEGEAVAPEEGTWVYAGALKAGDVTWSPAAQQLLEAVPVFVRGLVARKVEEYARRQGERVITVALMRAARGGKNPYRHWGE